MKPAFAWTACFALACAATSALAQTPCSQGPGTVCVTNGGFETQSPFGGGAEPQGWHNHSNPSECIYRRNGVSVIGSPDVTARTGNRCVQVTAAPDGGFRSFSTDIRNFFASGFPFYDPAFNWNGGDIVVEGWFMVPSTTPITGTDGFAAIKFTLKGAADPNQDNVSVDAWGNIGPPIFRITGHTCDTWVQYRAVLTMAEAHAQFAANGFNEGTDGVPTRIKPVLGMWFAGNIGTGTIFWDDVTVTQLAVGATPPPMLPPAGSSLCPSTGCPADFNGDTIVDPDDLSDYITCYFGEVGMPGACANADFNHDMVTDPDDLSDYITAFFSPCP